MSNFLTPPHYTNPQKSIISYEYVDFKAKLFLILYPPTWNSVIGITITQVQFQMKTFLDSVQETMEANQLELQENIEKIDDESEGLQFVIKSCANLSNSLQAVLFDMDAFERTLWNRMEKTVVKFDLKSNNVLE